jgi:hypothetical protein
MLPPEAMKTPVPTVPPIATNYKTVRTEHGEEHHGGTISIPAGDGSVGSSEVAGARECLASQDRLSIGPTFQSGGPWPWEQCAPKLGLCPSCEKEDLKLVN